MRTSRRATSSRSRFVASERSLPKYLLDSGVIHARIPFSRLITVTAVSTLDSFPPINSLLHISCRRAVDDRIRYRDIRFGGSTSPVGGMTRQGPNPLRVYLVQEPGHPATKVIGGTLLAIRLIAGSHSLLEITFPSIVSEPDRIVSVIPIGLDKFETRVFCRYDRLFPSAMWSSLRAH